jgi:3-oxo-5-alpha-steroid 4-dehydrogenase 1
MMSEDTFRILVYVWIGLGVLVFLLLLKVTAPYGRHAKGKWGPTVNNKLGWMIYELPSLLLITYFVITGPRFSSNIVLAFGLVWMIHYFYRAIIFPLRLRTKGKTVPLVIVFSAIFFNLVNASLNGYYLGYLSDYPSDWLTDPRFITGIIVFISGFIINQVSDQILLNLRRGGKTGYYIPRGWLYKYVSCPNFLGEIIEWTGFAIMAWNLPAFSFALWTAVNLIPRALDHHRWYNQTFPDYPKERKAIIPFLV